MIELIIITLLLGIFITVLLSFAVTREHQKQLDAMTDWMVAEGRSTDRKYRDMTDTMLRICYDVRKVTDAAAPSPEPPPQTDTNKPRSFANPMTLARRRGEEQLKKRLSEMPQE